MKLIYLKEGRNYSTSGLETCIKKQVQGNCDWVDAKFLEGLRDSINKEFKKSVVKGERDEKFVFHYLGLYDYTGAESGKNLTFFFLPKFIDFQRGSDCQYDGESQDGSEDVGVNVDSWDLRLKQFGERDRNAVLLAIDRYNKEQNTLAVQMDASEKRRESILELAVRVLRDYLESGLYIVRRRELERNGQGEIDWNTTIDEFQPVIVRGRPCYMDVLTEQAYSDEDHYITRLHKCLVTVWGRKLEELGLASVLRVNVPPLCEDELDHFGDPEYQVAQINKELNVQFVTKSRETLALIKDLIQRSTENQASNYESLSFGMTGVEHLWETACAEVLGTELDKKICDCGFPVSAADVTFSKYMPRVFWTNLVPNKEGACDSDEFNSDEGSQRSKKAGWRLDFIRTWRPNDCVEKLVILDAKYYCAKWRNGSISGQPGTPDIAKQMFYQMAFADLIAEMNVGIVNAFLLPEDDVSEVYKLGDDVKITETVVMMSMQQGCQQPKRAKAFEGINLFTVRIPGIRLLERYANWEIANDWFKKIVEEAPGGEGTNNRVPTSPQTPSPDEPDLTTPSFPGTSSEVKGLAFSSSAVLDMPNCRKGVGGDKDESLLSDHPGK